MLASLLCLLAQTEAMPKPIRRHMKTSIRLPGVNPSSQGVGRRRRLDWLRGHAAGVEQSTSTHSVSTSTNSVTSKADRRFFLLFPPFFKPYFGFGERKTIRSELVPGRIWGFEQEQTLATLSVNIRCTVVKLDSGGLWVHAPIFPTKEFLRQLDELGPVEHIILPTCAIEHKVTIAPFSRNYPNAKVWVAPKQWAIPLDLPLPLLGIPGKNVLGETKAEWQNEIHLSILELALGNPFVEVAFFHKATKSLILTDSAVRIPRDAPPVISRDLLLETAPDDPKDKGTVESSPAALQAGWAKTCLLVSYFGPGNNEQIGGFDLKWESGYKKSFEAIVNKLLVSPVLRFLVFDKSPEVTRAWVDSVCSWNFNKIIPAHYDAPIKAGPMDLKIAYSFVYDGLEGSILNALNRVSLPNVDLKTLKTLEKTLQDAGLYD